MVSPPPARAPSSAELAQHQPPPPPAPVASGPEPGPQLPAINGAAATVGITKSPTPDGDKSPAQNGAESTGAASRPLPTLTSLLNTNGADKDIQTSSRSGSRSPNTASRFPRDLAPERLAKNSTAADSSALNKLNSVFVRS
jgi:hypothetical protein